ncbi:7581_t:CDS:2 [Paraglomus occultum]|uniref:7581_t:CDS:1 n=1 Tax=Paraglomus occultum TaxID=144539 RepID=A0A9N9AAK8_9GLOM|nr:7581_t:CDS:2 [Paraglomus occultum]
MRLSHLQCTESFYKDNILQEISTQRVSNEEKKKILELLKRVGGEDIGADSDDEEVETNANDFVERFRSMDIESASYETIWNTLTAQERAEFEKLVLDKSSALFQEIHLWKPWWELSGLNDKTIQNPLIVELDESFPDKDISSPKIMKITKKLEELTNKLPNPMIIFNLLNILYAYVYGCRYLNGELSENVHETCNLIWSLSPVLALNEAIVYENVSEALAAGIQLSRQKYMESHEFTLILLNDINTLLADVDNVLAALSEIYSIFHTLSTARQTQESKPPVIPHSRKAFLTDKKVYFYFAYVQSLKEKDGAKAFDMLKTLIKSEKSNFEQQLKDHEMQQQQADELLKRRSTPATENFITEL